MTVQVPVRKHWRRAVVAMLVCWLASAGVACARDCAGFDAALADVATAHAQLVALPVDEELDPMLAPAAQRGIADSKAAIARVVAVRMACARGAESARDVERDLNRAMRALDAVCDQHCTQSPYRDVPQFSVTRPAQHPQLLAIVARLTIECGSDAALFVYEHAAGEWQQRVRWQSESYAKVSGAFEAFDFRIAPRDAHGNWYVLVKDIMPWCSSTWSTIRYAALHPASGQSAQRVVFRAQDSIWWGNDDTGRISADSNSFEVRFHAASIDAGVHNREWIRRFKIDGDGVRRMQPVAATPRDFADEWIVSSWQQAREWSHPQALTTLERWHEKLRGRSLPSYEFAAVHACYDHPHHFEVDMVDQRDQSEYFLSIEGRLIFTLSGVSQQANPSCKGDDLLEQMRTQ